MRPIFSRLGNRPAAHRRPAFQRPRLEALEDRSLMSAGDLDPTFGIGGKVTTGFSFFLSQDRANDLAVQPDGKIVAVGTADGVVALARYNPNGTPDPTFGLNGTTIFAGDRNHVFPGTAHAVALQPDGKIVVAGTNSVSFGGGFFVARYNTNGSLDNGGPNDSTPGDSFGTGGRVAPGFASEGRDLVLQPDGHIVVAGVSITGTRFALARYTPAGFLDPTFGDAGTVETPFAGTPDEHGYAAANAVALQPDGRIVVAGVAGHGFFGFDFALARYDVDGRLDGSFGGDGRITTNFGTQLSTPGYAGTNDEATDLAIQPDGQIVVVGESQNTTGRDFALARYQTNGAPDGPFGIAGKLTTDLDAGGFSDRANAIAVQANGTIVVAGTSAGDFALVCYLPDGSPDPDFGTGGTVFTDFSGSTDQALAVALQPDGKIVAAGSARVASPSGNHLDFALARYEGDPVSAVPAPPGEPLIGSAEAQDPSVAFVPAGVRIIETATRESTPTDRSAETPESSPVPLTDTDTATGGTRSSAGTSGEGELTGVDGGGGQLELSLDDAIFES